MLVICFWVTNMTYKAIAPKLVSYQLKTYDYMTNMTYTLIE